MEWVKKYRLLLCRIICILSFSVLIIVTLNQKSVLQKELNDCKKSMGEYEDTHKELKNQHDKLKDQFKQINEEKAKLNQENLILSEKIKTIENKLNNEKENQEKVVMQVSKLENENDLLKEKLKEKTYEVRHVIVDERIPESLIEFILEFSQAVEERDYEKYLSYWDLSHEYVNESMAEHWYKECIKGGHINRIRFYDQYGTGKGSITDDYFAVWIDMNGEYPWILAGGKKDNRWTIRFMD